MTHSKTQWLLAVVLLPGAASAAPCPEQADTVALAQDLQVAERAYVDLDVDGFQRAVDEAALLLPCLTETVGPDLAAWYHRVLGIRLFVGRETDTYAQSLAAARILDPDYVFPDDLVPKGHPIRTAYEGVSPALSRDTAVGKPLEHRLFFDGNEGWQRPTERATILQLVDADGAVQTAYLFSGDPLPSYPSEPPPPPPSAFRPHKALLIGAGVGALVAGGLWAGAAATEARFQSYDAERTLDDLERMQRTTNGLAIGAATAGGLSLAAGVGAFVAGNF